jgi:hypothetical protein
LARGGAGLLAEACHLVEQRHGLQARAATGKREVCSSDALSPWFQVCSQPAGGAPGGPRGARLVSLVARPRPTAGSLLGFLCSLVGDRTKMI